MKKCVIYWKKTGPNQISERTSFCCQTLKEAVEEGFHADMKKGRLGHIPHYRIGYIYYSKGPNVLEECPFCHAPIVDEEVKGELFED